MMSAKRAKIVARSAARDICDSCFESHCGAMRWCGHIVLYGNDGYMQDERTRLEVEVVRQHTPTA